MGLTLFLSILLLSILFLTWRKYKKIARRPKYQTLEKEGSIEIREYPPLIVAETKAKGGRKESIREGFIRVARYIFGENLSSKKIAMTSPVLQQEGAGFWNIYFLMPKKHTLETLPKPKDRDIRLRKLPAATKATIRFSGKPERENLEKHLSLLTSFLKKKRIQSTSSPTYAFYNPPWTLPIFRRNEIWLDIKRK